MVYTQFHLVIVGASVAGCCTALGLANKGLKVAIVEKQLLSDYKASSKMVASNIWVLDKGDSYIACFPKQQVLRTPRRLFWSSPVSSELKRLCFEG